MASLDLSEVHALADDLRDGADITVEARNRVLQRHRVLNLMTHLDPWHKPDLDHNQARTA